MWVGGREALRGVRHSTAWRSSELASQSVVAEPVGRTVTEGTGFCGGESVRGVGRRG